MKKNFILFLMFFCFTVSSYGANITWTGAMSNDWNTAGNWNTGNVPGASDYAAIGAGATVNISGATAATVKNIRVIDATLTIMVGGSLACDTALPGFAGMWVQGSTINNSGTITINNIAGNHGILLNGTNPSFNNMSGATLAIGGVGSIGGRGIICQAGTFTNNVMISIDDCGNAGIEVQAGATSFDNQATGVITIGTNVACNHRGINNSNASVTNSGTITIGTIAFEGLVNNNGAQFTNSGTFTLNFGGGSNAYGAPGTGKLINTGTIKGNGKIEGKAINFDNTGGTISPGNSPGSFTFLHGYTNSTYVVELQDAANFDKITLSNGTSGLFTLGGTLDVQILGAGPAINDQFIFIDAVNGYTGTFATVNWPSAASEWELTYNTNDVTIKYLGSPLPIELTSFSANPTKEAINLKWETASETNNKGFQIEKSANGQDWTTLSWMDGHETTTVKSNYRFTDNTPFDGLNYYRLKQIDFDGGFEYSNIVEANWKKSETHVTLYPNPAQDIINVTLPTSEEVKNIRVYDTVGRMVLDLNTSETQLHIDGLDNGIYTIQIQTKVQSYMSTFVKK